MSDKLRKDMAAVVYREMSDTFLSDDWFVHDPLGAKEASNRLYEPVEDAVRKIFMPIWYKILDVDGDL